MDKNIVYDSPISEKLGPVDIESNDKMESFEEIAKVDSQLGKDDENVISSSVLESKCEGDNEGGCVTPDDICKVDASEDVEFAIEAGQSNDDVQQVGVGVELNAEGVGSGCKLEQGNEQITVVSKEKEPVRDGTEREADGTAKSSHSMSTLVSGQEEHAKDETDGEANRSATSASETEGSIWSDKAVTLRNFVNNKGVVAVSNFLNVLSGKRDGVEQLPGGDEKTSDSAKDRELAEVSQKQRDRSVWNPLSYIMTSQNGDAENMVEQVTEAIEDPLEPIVMKGRIILYTRLGCQNCKEVRLFLYNRRLRYVEINIDVYPSRKLELEKFTGSSAVPKVFFNEVVIGGLGELKVLQESGNLQEKIDYLINEPPTYEAPLPPLSGEDDASTSGSIDELALIVRKMKESIVVKDRFYKMRRFSSCFRGSDAVDFLSEDQYLEREETIEFGRKLASKLFFRHILDSENLFEDGNHFYWFLDDDPAVSSQCHNIPRGIIEAKPKPITDIASRLRFLFYAINEAYTSEDGMHVDYRSIHGSEEFARYLRIIQELQRVEFQGLSREEKLAFFINLYNMMIIHAILVFGHPSGALERRKFFGDFKYVIGGCTFSLSDIQNGILRGNQRPPYNLMKPFGVNDKRCKAALPYPEPLIHFALVNGTRSGPALRCYSPGDIDMELMDAARSFLRGGGLVIDAHAKVAYASLILKWFSIDFGKNEVEVLKHASNYLESANSEGLLELLADGQLKVQYQPYDWGLSL